MIYALCSEGLSYGDEADGVLQFADEATAEQAFREYVNTHAPSRRYSNIFQRYLFRTREDAEAANQTDDDEVTIDETKAFRTLDWERGFGYNF